MKIAFDCKGTLSGYHEKKVVKLFHALQDAGHELFIWSSVYSYTHDAAAKHGLQIPEYNYVAKYSELEAREQGLPVMDIAIDDDMFSLYLAAQKMICVDQIPENEADFETFVNELTSRRT
jgi:hypothetical protein